MKLGKIKKKLRKSDIFMKCWYRFCILTSKLIGDKNLCKIKYRLSFGKKLNLSNPQTLNEKIQWLKIYSHEDLHTIVADKYAARKWLSDRFGEEYLVPLLFYTDDWKEITAENIPNEACIVKANNGNGDFVIIKDKKNVNWEELRKKAKYWLSSCHYYRSQEWQYKNMKPYIIVEKLLQTKDGKIPNDYKLHFINGKLEFVYCSVDREGHNYRNIYDADWKPLYFTWVSKYDYREDLRGPEIEAPASYSKMVEIGTEIAKLFKYVRVDFYDVDGKLYYGEVTLHHGSGFDHFVPEEYDLIYGKKLKLD